VKHSRGRRIRVIIEARGAGLPPAAGMLLYRTVHDAMAHLSRGGGLSGFTIRVRRQQGTLIMDVQDSGRSFDPARIWLRRDARRLGFLCMRERVAMADGVLELKEGPEQGTTLRVSLPAGNPGGGRP